MRIDSNARPFLESPENGRHNARQILASFPGLDVEQAGVLQSVFEFSVGAFDTELNDAVIYIHKFISVTPCWV
jgi:hypothetical protein